MGKGSRLRRKQRRKEKRAQHKTSYADLYGFNTLHINNDLPENINFTVK